MGKCDRYIDWISAYIDGELTDAESSALKSHLETCPDCRRIMEAYLAVSASMEELVEPPEDLARNVMREIETQPRPKRSRGKLVVFRRVAAVAAVFALVAFAGLSGVLEDFLPGGDSDGEESDLSMASYEELDQDETPEEALIEIAEDVYGDEVESVPDAGSEAFPVLPYEEGEIGEAPGEAEDDADERIDALEADYTYLEVYQVEEEARSLIGRTEDQSLVTLLLSLDRMGIQPDFEPDYEVATEQYGTQIIYLIWLLEDGLLFQEEGVEGWSYSTLSVEEFIALVDDGLE